MKLTPFTSPLKPGKYVTRGGNIVHVEDHSDAPYIFKTRIEGQFVTYTEKGERYSGVSKSPENILFEVIDTNENEEFSCAPPPSTQGHPHAELMRLYAEDAAETDKPWERWEWKRKGGISWDPYRCGMSPSWNPNNQYRRKPRTIRIGDFDVPEPFRGKPEKNRHYYIPHLTMEKGYVRRIIDKRKRLIDLINLGVVHETTEAAQLHAKALLSLTSNPKPEKQ